MPIQVSCSGCQGVFRVPDKGAGKKIKCPKCEAIIQVPAGETVGTAAAAQGGQKAAANGGQKAAAGGGQKVAAGGGQKVAAGGGQAAAAKKTATEKKATEKTAAKKPSAAPKKQSESEQWYVKTATGETYGPVSKTDLDDWVAEGRVDEQDQLLQDGSENWQWASDVFPSLGGDPLAAAAGAEQPLDNDPLGLSGGDLADEPIPDEPIADASFSDPLSADEPIPDEPVASPKLPAAPTTQSLKQQAQTQQQATAQQAATDSDYTGQISDRRRRTAGLLGIFLCLFASHQFYLGNVGRGVIQAFLSLCTVGIASIWSLIEGILILAGKINTDAQGRPLRED